MEQQHTMKRIVKSSDNETGNLSKTHFEYMKTVNRQPEFNEADKNWKFHSVMKSTTDVTPWLISIGEEHFAALQVPPIARGIHSVKIFNATECGTYSHEPGTEVMVLPLYVDLESACDEFAKNYGNM